MIRIIYSGLLLMYLGITTAHADPDKPFRQPVSVKYIVSESLKGSVLQKVVCDYNDNIYVLSDKGVLRISNNELVKDIRYTPLANTIPVDINVQEQSGHVYYLYKNHLLSNGYAGKPYAEFPEGKYSRLAVSADGTVLLAGPNAVALVTSGNVKELSENVPDVLSVNAHHRNFYLLSRTGIYSLINGTLRKIHSGSNFNAIDFRGDEIIIGTDAGYYGINAVSGDTITSLHAKVPVPDVDCIAVVKGNVWAGTREGGFMQETAKGYRYYASKRWLEDDEVKSICSDSKGNVYFLTDGAVNEIRFSEFTLAKKAIYFQDKIRERHIRYGFIANATFQRPGDVSTAQLTDTDNDGLWSAFYLGSQAFRFATTGEKAAKRYAWEAFEAFERLISINPLIGFPARTFERKGFKNSDPERWHDSQEKGWEWKGTTSSDEFVAYIWVSAIMSEMVAQTKAEKERVAAFIDKILTHIIDNDYNFVDADGKPTLWGRWNPSYINSYPETVGDRRLGSTTIIAGLQLGYRLTGKEKYKSEALKLMNVHGYLKNIQLPYSHIKSTPGVLHEGIDMGDGGWNHSDDEMAFLTYWVLYHYAFDDNLKKKYASAIEDHWRIERPEKNALWNLITYGTIGKLDKASTFWHLKEFPIDLIRWNVKNSHRKDIELLPPNFRNQTTKELLPPAEVPIHRHNTNAFILDGGENGMSELAGDEYLLPYWMARYLKVLQ
jgi:hypothetical protein